MMAEVVERKPAKVVLRFTIFYLFALEFNLQIELFSLNVE